MKTFLPVTLLCFLFHFQSSGQFCNQSLIPNQASRGQILTTTISGTQLFPGYGSAPCSPSEVYLYQSSTATTIYASTLSNQNDTVRVSWNIPSNAPIGGYDLNLMLYGYSPFNSCMGVPTNCIIPQAFGVGSSIISGSVYFDSNQDSTFNSNDLYLSNRRVLLLPENVTTFTNNLGHYNFFADTGSHIVVILNDSSFTSVNTDSIALNIGNVNVDSLDFAIYPTSSSYETEVYISGRPRCNTTQGYTVICYNYSVFPVNYLLKIYHTSNTPFVNSTPAHDSIVGDTVYISIPGNQYGSDYLTVNFQIPNAGSSVGFSAQLITYDLGGNIVDTTSAYIYQNVTCSFDPNDKAVYPSGEQLPHYTLIGEELFYLIRFQNTGNDTAYDVHIMDTLDASLDISSMQMMESSHPLIVELYPNGVVNFKFNNIMLPDSFVDEPASNGFLSYKIRHLTPIPELTEIRNRAHIYFDQNVPVATNQTFNTMVVNIPLGINMLTDNNNISLYPNPFNESVTIGNKGNEAFEYNIVITDIQGRVLKNTIVTSSYPSIDLQGLSSGIYIYKLSNKTDNLLYIGRLIKQ